MSLVLGAAIRLCGVGARTRACWFESRGVDEERRLVPVRYWGRGAVPRTTFRATELRGRELLAGLEAGRHELWRSLFFASVLVLPLAFRVIRFPRPSNPIVDWGRCSRRWRSTDRCGWTATPRR